MSKEKLSIEKIKKDKVLNVLINSKDITQAAKTANVSRKTIYSYLKNREFIEAYGNIKQIQMREITEKIADGANISTDYLISAINGNFISSNTKIQLCIKLLNLYTKFIFMEKNIDSSIVKESEELHFDISSIFKN